MKRSFPSEEDFSRVEELLAKQVSAGQRLTEELRTVVNEVLREQLDPIEQRINETEEVAHQVRESVGNLQVLINDIQALVKANKQDSVERAQETAATLGRGVDELRTAMREYEGKARALNTEVSVTRNELLKSIEDVELTSKRRNTVVLRVAVAAVALSLVGLTLWYL